MNIPSKQNGYQWRHVKTMSDCLEKFTGKKLVDSTLSSIEQARELFYSPIVVASHNDNNDPILNYGNIAALKLWEVDWEVFTSMLSRKTAEGIEGKERQKMLEAVRKNNYYDNYSGIRISATGRRFYIEKVTIWNLYDDTRDYRGQAAMFSDYGYLD